MSVDSKFDKSKINTDDTEALVEDTRLGTNDASVKIEDPEQQLDISGLKSEDTQLEADDTQFSRPPWAKLAEPKSWDTANRHTDGVARGFVHKQSSYMGRHSILWHTQKTLADKEFWKLEFVKHTDRSTSLGFSSGNVKRAIEWLGEPNEFFTIKDRTPGGSQSYYWAFMGEPVVGGLDIYAPSEERVFQKVVYPKGPSSVGVNKLGVEDKWDLPTDPLGVKLKGEVTDSMRQVEGPCTFNGVVEYWLRGQQSRNKRD